MSGQLYVRDRVVVRKVGHMPVCAWVKDIGTWSGEPSALVVYENKLCDIVPLECCSIDPSYDDNGCPVSLTDILGSFHRAEPLGESDSEYDGVEYEGMIIRHLQVANDLRVFRVILDIGPSITIQVHGELEGDEMEIWQWELSNTSMERLK